MNVIKEFYRRSTRYRNRRHIPQSLFGDIYPKARGCPLARRGKRDEIGLCRSADKGPVKGLRKGEERAQQSQCLAFNRCCNRVTVAPHILIVR